MLSKGQDAVKIACFFEFFIVCLCVSVCDKVSIICDEIAMKRIMLV
jgi:hypothetical protein